MRKSLRKLNKRTRDVYIFTAIIVGLTVFFNPYFPVHFSNDDYSQEAFPVEGFAAQASSQGRPLLALSLTVFHRVGINVVTHQVYLWPIVILIYATAVFVFYKLLSRTAESFRVQEKAALLFFACSVLMTWGAVDLQTYASMNLAYAMAFFAMIISIYIGVTRKGAHAWIFTALFASVSLFFHQGWMSAFLALALTVLLVTHDAWRMLWHKMVMFVCSFGVAYVADLLWVKYFHALVPIWRHWVDDRAGQSPGLVDNAHEIFVGVINVMKGYHLFPSYIFIFFLLITLLFPLLFFIHEKRSALIAVLHNVCIVGIAIVCASAPHLFTARVNYSLRSVIVFSLIPIFLSILNFFAVRKMATHTCRIASMQTVIVVIVFFYVGLGFFVVEKFGNDLRELNAIDRLVAMQFYGEIQKYEKKEGIVIEKIFFVADANPHGCYKDIVNCGNGVLYLKATAVPWSNVFPLNKISGRQWQLQSVEESGQYLEKFNDKNWDNINVKEQITFNKNMAIIAVF